MNGENSSYFKVPAVNIFWKKKSVQSIEFKLFCKYLI